MVFRRESGAIQKLSHKFHLNLLLLHQNFQLWMKNGSHFFPQSISTFKPLFFISYSGITIWAIVFIHIISNIRMALASAMINMESPFVNGNKYKVVSLLVRIPNLPKVKQVGLFRRQFISETHINKLFDTDLQQFGRRLVAHHGGKLGKANLHFLNF